MKKLIRKIIHNLGNIFRGLRLILLKMSGVKIGKNTMISLGAKIDTRRGNITIGNNCLITHGCYILSHDGAAHVLDKNDNGEGFVKIGNNVFIGVNSVIMRNVTIGDNAIVGAGSVVIKDVPEGVVVVGNPAKMIKKISKPYRDLPKIN